jgi:hypothetical protein
VTDDALIAFLNARLDEREHFAKIARLAQKHREQMLREVEVMRTIADDMARTVKGEFIDEGECVVAAGVLRDLATIWSDHPEYRPEWKP